MDLLTAARAVVDTAESLATEPGASLWLGRVQKAWDRLAASPDAEWASYNAWLLLTQVTKGADWMPFDGTQPPLALAADDLAQALTAFTTGPDRERPTRDLRAWQQVHGIVPDPPRPGRPPGA